MGIVLLILKIIGIILLSIIGLLVLIMLLLMFWPFTYRLKAFKNEKDYDVAFRLLWLLGLVTATINYNGEAWLIFRIIGIPVYKIKIWPVEKEKDTEESLEEETDESEVLSADADETASDVPESEYFEEEYEGCDVENEEAFYRDIEECWNDDTEEDAFDKLPFAKKVKAFIEKIKELILKCRQKCYNIKDSIYEFIEKIKKQYKNIKHYIKLLQHPCIKPALKKIWKITKVILKHIRPRRIKANVTYGSGDPASTMKVYGYYCMIYPFYGKKIKFMPDMENKVLNFDAKISGRFQLFRMMLVGWSAFADRNIRKLIRLIRREVKRRGRK